MSYENIKNLLVALDRPFGQGGLPVLGVDPQIGTAAQTIDLVLRLTLNMLLVVMMMN